jgi:hypothetical protein
VITGLAMMLVGVLMFFYRHVAADTISHVFAHRFPGSSVKKFVAVYVIAFSVSSSPC